MQETFRSEYKDKASINNPVILFDGVCNLCSSVVKFTILRDPNGLFRFASLQSEAGKKFLDRFNLPTDNYSSLILIEGDKYFLRSTASLKLFRNLNGIWPLFYVFMIIPRPIRDFVYNIIANNRFNWFGKKEECFIPTTDLKDRFLDNR